MGFTRGRWPEEKKQKAPLYGGKGKQEEETMSIYGQTKGTELEAMAKQYQMNVEDIEGFMGDAEKDSIKKDLAVKKAVKVVVDNAKEV